MKNGLRSLEGFLMPAPGATGCPNCSMVFESMEYLEIHINSTSTMCDLCSMQCCSDINLKNHMKLECDLVNINRNFELVVQDSAISSRNRTNPEEYIEGFKSNDGENLFPCVGCEEIFETREELKQHKIKRHPELYQFRPVELDPEDNDPKDRLMAFACPVCERKFGFIHACSVHIKVHHFGWKQRKLFYCTECGKYFASQKVLNTHHERDHQGIRTMCPLCHKAIKSTTLNGHLNMVHNDALKEWPCTDCSKKFKRKCDLIRHTKTVHLGVRDHPCDVCGKRFGDNKDMVRHRNAVHMGVKVGPGNWKGRMDVTELEVKTREMTVMLEDGSKVSIQKYMEEQESLVQDGLQGSYLQDKRESVG